MLNPGMILDERYEIVDVVGSGGMSIVYKAKDHRLKRYVAIKVLKPEFSSDMNFVSKFRVEAQSSAGLTHPNIVNVYDVSEDNGFYFIVMELVEGITLKEYINLNGRLSMDQAIDFSIQIASGLEAAHENHVIHRDIKPQNIIVAKNGNLKVTDFGIAKAATSNTMSTTGMGSVHYISPEQARGGYSDERSDIYSLGITMYEMVTGRVPFEGDTNVSIALMHIQNNLVPPRQYYPDIYSSFEKIIMKATQKKPERRYLTANALIADLKRVKANPNIDIIVAPQGVTNAPTQQFTPEQMQAIKSGSAVKDATQLDGYQNVNGTNINQDMQPGYQSADMNAARRPVNQQSSRPVPNSQKLNQLLQEEDYDDYDDEYYDETPAPKKKGGIKKVEDDYDDDDYDYDDYNDDEERLSDGVDPKIAKAVMIGGVAAAIIIFVIILIVVGKIMGWFKFGSGNTTTEPIISTEQEVEKIAMLDVKGVTKEAAEKLLNDAGFTNIRCEAEASTDVQENYVIDQSIEKDEMINPDQEIVLKISAGADTVAVEDVVGKTNDEGTSILEQNFKVTHSFQSDDTVEKDKIISTNPVAGTQLAAGSTINIVVSNGPDIKEVQVPKVTGVTESAAKTSLESLNLTVGNVSHENSDTVEAGLVIRQGVSAGISVKEGTSIDLVISDGKKEVKYTGTVSGQIALNDDLEEMTNVDGITEVIVQVYLNVGNASYTVCSKNVNISNGFPVDVSGSVSDLTTNSGTVTFKVLFNDNDITGSYGFSKNCDVTFTQQ